MHPKDALNKLVETFGQPEINRGKFYFQSPRGKIEFCMPCGYVRFGVGQLDTIKLRLWGKDFGDDFMTTLEDWSKTRENHKSTIKECLDKLKFFGK